MKTQGKIWFLLQFILFCAIFVSPIIERAAFPLWLRAIGFGVLASGIVIAVQGYRTLGKSHSPWTNPVEGGQLTDIGIYSRMRHPIYAGWIVGTLGLELLAGSLLGVGVAVALLIFYDFKSREEEKWLAQRYPDYPAYKSRVSRFIPRVY